VVGGWWLVVSGQWLVVFLKKVAGGLKVVEFGYFHIYQRHGMRGLCVAERGFSAENVG
jgi:hypothetical protein